MVRICSREQIVDAGVHESDLPGKKEGEYFLVDENASIYQMVGNMEQCVVQDGTLLDKEDRKDILGGLNV